MSDEQEFGYTKNPFDALVEACEGADVLYLASYDPETECVLGIPVCSENLGSWPVSLIGPARTAIDSKFPIVPAEGNEALDALFAEVFNVKDVR